jgi:hypothetical protein
MQLFFDSPSPTQIKMILLGFSGQGKSTVTTSLAIPDLVSGWPGKKLFVLDFDAAGKYEEVFRSSIMARLSKKKITEAQAKAAFANVDVEVCRETTGVIREGDTKKLGVIGGATAWKKAVEALGRWQKDLTPDAVLIVDSLTFAATVAIVNFCQALQGNLNKSMSGDFRQYMMPQEVVKSLLNTLADMRCNVVLTAHQEPVDIKMKTDEMIEKKDGTQERAEVVVDTIMAPISIGSKGRINIPAGFNHQLVMAQNKAGERRLWTQDADGVVAKTPFFARAEANYGLDDGLVKYFMLGQ